MAVVFLSTPASMTAEPHDRVIKQLDASGACDRPGRRFHPCFGSAHHLTVVDVWDCADEFQAFGMTLMPSLAEEQIEMAPAEPLEIHRLIEGGDASVLRKAVAELRNTAFSNAPSRAWRRHGETRPRAADPTGRPTVTRRTRAGRARPRRQPRGSRGVAAGAAHRPEVLQPGDVGGRPASTEQPSRVREPGATGDRVRVTGAVGVGVMGSTVGAPRQGRVLERRRSEGGQGPSDDGRGAVARRLLPAPRRSSGGCCSGARRQGPKSGSGEHLDTVRYGRRNGAAAARCRPPARRARSTWWCGRAWRDVRRWLDDGPRVWGQLSDAVIVAVTGAP